MLIINQLLAEPTERIENQPEKIGRIGGVNVIEPSSSRDPEHQCERAEHCPTVLKKIPPALAGLVEGITVNTYAFKNFKAPMILMATARANHADFITGCTQGDCFMPHATIHRKRQILDEYKHAAAA